MSLVETHKLTPKIIDGLPKNDKLQVYNALDCCLTLEVFEEISKLFNTPPEIYDFERAIQAPYLEIMARGFRVDEISRRHAATVLRDRITRLQDRLDRVADAVWHRPLNPRSSKQLKEFFYGAMRLPEVKIGIKGEWKVSTNREALEKLEAVYLHARPFVNAILSIRDLSKQLQVFDTEIDLDSRFRTSYNIAGTETGRPSSSENAFGTGGNAQNISPYLRYVFVSDSEHCLVNVDLEQVEARDVGFICGCLFDDWSFLDACECLTGDHEVLTPSGWKLIEKQPEEIAVWKVSGDIEFEVPAKWNSGEQSNLISAENRSISVLGTYNHSMPVVAYHESRIERRSLREIRDSPNFTAPATGIYAGGSENVKEAELIAAFQADGTRDHLGKVHWTFVKEHKIYALRRILDELNMKYSIYCLSAGSVRFYLHANQGQDRWRKTCGPEILLWNIDTLHKFCSSHKIWDASVENNTIRIVSKSREHLDWLGTAYFLTGNSVAVNRHKSIYWILTIKSRSNHQYRSAVIKEITLNVPVKVYCPTVSTGYFIVRRNGKIFISGNSGDLHTSNARLIWPDLGWTGDLATDRKLAETQFYRDFSYRDMAKRGSHLSNYVGTAQTASRHLKVPFELVDEFQARYCKGRPADPKRNREAITPAYPVIPRYWQWVATELQSTHLLHNLFGRRRHFFGRPNEDATLREGVAFIPQSTTADRMNLGLYRVWRYMPDVQLLAQTHDSITFQIRENKPVDDLIAEVLERIKVELIAPNGRSYTVPGEATIGYNWGKISDKNPDGLRRWKPGLKMQRTAPLQRIMPS